MQCYNITSKAGGQAQDDESPLDFPIAVTVFGNRYALKMQEQSLSLRDLAGRQPEAKSKAWMRHIKLGRFSGETTERGAFRHNAGHLSASGIEGDYDAGEMPVDDAVDALARAGVAAMVYTTPSHQKDGKGHRWRVLCPLANEVTPAKREQLVARVNGVLGGVLSGESFTASQSYAFGAVKGQDAPDVRLVDGRFLDDCGDLDDGAIGKPRRDRGKTVPATDLSDDEWRVDKAGRMLEAAADRLTDTLTERNAALCREGFFAGGLLANNLVTREQVLESFLPAMTENGYLDDHAGGDEAEVERIIDSQLKAGGRDPFDPAGGADDWDDEEPEQRELSIAELLGDEEESPEVVEPDFLESAACFEGVEVPPREWMVPDLIPHRTVTILGGDGGTGKSLLALQLAVATVTGREWMDQAVARPGGVICISAEDERDELHRRWTAICEQEALAFSDLSKLQFKSLAGENAILAELDRRGGKLKPTKLFKKLDAAVAEAKPSLVILDTLADLHSGDQNDQGHARQFITLLRGLCVHHGCTVLLLAHPSLTGINSGTGTGGSMAWGNSVRSRLYLRRVKEGKDGQEMDPDSRVLETMKANYGQTGGQIGLRWQAGVFRAISKEDESEMHHKAEGVFIKLLKEATEAGQRVSSGTGKNYAPAVFEDEAAAQGITKRALKEAMATMLKDERLAIEVTGPQSRQRKCLVEGRWGFTDE